MEDLDQYMDSIHVAAQLGRLDFISALLAIIALSGIIGAFPVFFYLRKKAGDEAKAVVEIEIAGLERKIEQRAIARMEQLLPDLMAEYGKFAQDAVSSDIADAIASAQENSDHVDD